MKRSVWTVLLGGLAAAFLINSWTAPTATAPSACKSDWHQCVDNSDLANNYGKMFGIRYDCIKAAIVLARYGTPEWPALVSETFGSFFKGKEYIVTGVATLLEHGAKFQNGFGAMAHVTVTCDYDLNSKQVKNVNIIEQ